jgi:proteasome component ECM29
VNVLPIDYAPARYLLLFAAADSKEKVYSTALKSLYGTKNKNKRYKCLTKDIALPDFSQFMSYIHSKVEGRIHSNHKVINGNTVLPFNTAAFAEVNMCLHIKITLKH